MATLSDGRHVHVGRIEKGGDLYDKISESGLQVVNRWIKKEDKKEKK